MQRILAALFVICTSGAAACTFDGSGLPAGKGNAGGGGGGGGGGAGDPEVDAGAPAPSFDASPATPDACSKDKCEGGHSGPG
jgi:hypothetical protein